MKCNYCEKEHDSDYICDEMFGSHAKSVLSLTTAREARLVEALEQEVYRLNNHDMHLDIGGMAEDSVVPCPVCEECTRIWAIIHPEDADIKPQDRGEK